MSLPFYLFSFLPLSLSPSLPFYEFPVWIKLSNLSYYRYYHYYYCYYYYYYYYYYYCYYVYFGLVGTSVTFPKEQVAPSNIRSLGLVLQFLQFQAMLLFAKALCYYFLHLISSASLSIFLMSPLGLPVQLEQLLKSYNILTLSFATTLAGLWLYH